MTSASSATSEGDLIIGKANRSALMTLVEHVSRTQVILDLPEGHRSAPTCARLDEWIAATPSRELRSITCDRGSSMADSRWITAARTVGFYSADAHSPWQPGGNENGNHQIRYWPPKGSDVSVHTQADLDHICHNLNTQPLALEICEACRRWRNGRLCGYDRHPLARIDGMIVGGLHMALFKRSDDKTADDRARSDDMVSFDDDAYAWWADRDELEKTFVPKKRHDPRPHSGRPKAGDPPVSDSGDSEFAKRYSTESLFNWASSPEPDDPTHGGTGLPIDPYLVLGLEPGASLSNVVAAHRALAKRYHPDQFFQASPDEQHEAAHKMSTINAAYQELRSRLMAHRHAH